jgi:carboxylate-amine ligase
VKTPALPLGLFQGYGIELEYIIVDRETLDARPIADLLLKEISGRFDTQVEVGELAWSNEIVLHVIELKTNGPVDSLTGLPGLFLEHVRRINGILSPLGARLMPTAAHPWLDPARETRLWPHEFNPVYEAYDRIFDCRGHGWANLQASHINLPFAGEEEFGRLHAAIRMLLPIMPALAAGSPVLDGKTTGILDNRIKFYSTNSSRIPSVGGAIIPEPVFTFAGYHTDILQKMYADIRPLDPAGVLQHEWLNARGAIARFERNTFEIRLIDMQETPAADIAIAWGFVRVLKELTAERLIDLRGQKAWSEFPLRDILFETAKDAEEAVITDRNYLDAFGYPGGGRASAGELWAHLIEALPENPEDKEHKKVLSFILEKGTLSRRILRALSGGASPGKLREVYRTLCDCLSEGTLFMS